MYWRSMSVMMEYCYLNGISSLLAITFDSKYLEIMSAAYSTTTSHQANNIPPAIDMLCYDHRVHEMHLRIFPFPFPHCTQQADRTRLIIPIYLSSIPQSITLCSLGLQESHRRHTSNLHFFPHRQHIFGGRICAFLVGSVTSYLV